MDASSDEIGSIFHHQPLQGMASGTYIPPLGSNLVSNRGSRQLGGDRFSPLRSAMDFDLAHSILTKRKRENVASTGLASKDAYRRLLDEVMMPYTSRILAFKSKPPTRFDPLNVQDVLSDETKSSKQQGNVLRCCDTSVIAPGVVDNYNANLLDWGCSAGNKLLFGLGNETLLRLSDNTFRRIMEVEEDGPVTSVSWAPDGQHIAIGLASCIQYWDVGSCRLLRDLVGAHESPTVSLSWNKDRNLLSTGGIEGGLIVNLDMRKNSPFVNTYQGHRKAVCGLNWSDSGSYLASGGSDKLLHKWDPKMASSKWLHRFEDHTDTVKALAWCPFTNNLLASGGGGSDRCIKFWNVNTGACLNSVDTGSEVWTLLWNKNERKLLSSHGSPHNQLSLWKYPSMVRMRDLMGHTVGISVL